MTPADSAIARRLRVQCDRFGWGEGSSFWVQSYSAPRDEWPGGWGESWPERVDGDMTRHESKYRTHEDTEGDQRIVGPDPHDPATIGCFAAMARKATGLRLYAVPDNSGTWVVCTQSTMGGDNEPMNPGPDGMWSHATEIESWLAVLEATP